MNRYQLPFLAAGLALLASCTAPPERPAGDTGAAPVGGASLVDKLAGLPGDGIASWTLDDASSRVHVLVYPDGRMKRFGHHHVVRPVGLRGRLVERSDGSARGRVVLDLRAMRVDEPADRALEQDAFSKPLNAQSVSGTRANMLGPVLDADSHPLAILDAELDALQPGPALARVQVRLAGTGRDLDVPLQVQRVGAALLLSGTFSLRQSDFGIQPFSALAGALRVRDRLDIRFELRALR